VKKLLQFLANLLKIQSGSPFLGYDHQVAGRRKILLLGSKKLSEETFHTIPLHCRPYDFAYRNSESPVAEFIGAQGDAKMVGLTLCPSLENPQEIRTVADSLLFRKRIKAHLLRFSALGGSPSQY
jgi:hypothetical protein